MPFLYLFAAPCVACGDDAVPLDTEGTTGGGTTADGTGAGASTETSPSGEDDDTAAPGGCPLGCADVGPDPGQPPGGSGQCDPWSQDCPAGEKCTPWANDGGSSWNATKCSPLDPDPAQVGDRCTVEGSGVDDCDVGLMCWNVDTETNEGHCIAMCRGAPATPWCADAGTVCGIFNNGVLILCFPRCDPLLTDCRDDEVCIATSNGDFVCGPDASGDEGQYGDPCEFVNVCDPGLFCAGAQAVPGCDTSVGCCSELCDLTSADPAAACSGRAQGQECIPWFPEDMPPPPGVPRGIGACALP